MISCLHQSFLEVQESGFIRGINRKSKIQNSQESGPVRTARGGGDAGSPPVPRQSKIQNLKSKIV
jgi:hypothetical protein